MNQITGYDVAEFLQKLAADLPDFRNLPSLDLDADKVRKNLGMKSIQGVDVGKVNSGLRKNDVKPPKMSFLNS